MDKNQYQTGMNSESLYERILAVQNKNSRKKMYCVASPRVAHVFHVINVLKNKRLMRKIKFVDSRINKVCGMVR